MRLLHLLLLTAVAATPGRSSVSLPRIFTDSMVLQRDESVALWGTASAGEQVSVRFASDTVSAVADSQGNWSVRLGPFAASAEGRDLVVTASNTITLSDVLVGEVWFCSGQSNMEKELGARPGQSPCDNHEVEIAAADHPMLRLYPYPRHGKPVEGDLSLKWLPCTPENLSKSRFSAAAFYFGRHLQGELKVPIGLIHSSVGGSRIEAWTPASAFAPIPHFSAINEAVVSGQPYRGQRVGNLYESMVQPLIPFTVRGWLWYQGESNLMSHEADIYADKMRLLIETWRTAWRRPEASFYHVQLAPYAYSRRRQAEPLSPEALPLFWEAQNRSLALPHTGQAVINDTVTRYSDIHPTNKRDVGVRLALVALRDTYGKTSLVASGPLNKGHHRRGREMVLDFDFAEGLAARSGSLTGFMIAAEDQQFVPATAEIRGTQVLVSAPEVPEPAAVRYGWHEARPGNLVNAAGLPARAFRTDTWHVTSARPATPEDLAASPAKSAPPAQPAPPTPGEGRQRAG